MARKPYEGWAKPVSDFSIEHGTPGIVMQVIGSTDDVGVQTARISIATPGVIGALAYSISEGRELIVQGTGPAAGALLEALSELSAQLRAIAK